MIEGGCRCGACRYTIAMDSLPAAYACHCHLCQRWSGSAFSLNVLVAEASVAATGPIVLYETVREERASLQRMCGECHARLYNTNTGRADIAIIRAGTLDRSEELVCRAHIFTDYKQAWVTLGDGVPQWGEAPDPTDFVAALTR